MRKSNNNKGYTMVEVLVSLVIITFIVISIVQINGSALQSYSAGIHQMQEINELTSAAEGIYTDDLQEHITKTNKWTLDYILKIDASNTTYSTYLDPDDDYTYRGSGMYMRYEIDKFQINEDYAAMAPYWMERYHTYEY